MVVSETRDQINPHIGTVSCWKHTVKESFNEVFSLATNIEWEKPAAHVICSFMDSSE